MTSIDALKDLFPIIIDQLKRNSKARGLGKHSFEIQPAVSKASEQDYGWVILQDNKPIFVLDPSGVVFPYAEDDSLFDLTEIKSRTEFLSTIQAQEK